MRPRQPSREMLARTAPQRWRIDFYTLLQYIGAASNHRTRSMHRRAAELAEMESFISTRGPTRCPERYAAFVRDALSPIIEAARIAAIVIVERGLSFKEERDRFFARLR